jgi:hypothetical protein
MGYLYGLSIFFGFGLIYLHFTFQNLNLYFVQNITLSLSLIIIWFSVLGLFTVFSISDKLDDIKKTKLDSES